MENINYKIEQSSFLIDQSLEGLPIGIAYLLLKDKVKKIEQLYYKQVLLQTNQQQLEKQQQQEKQKEDKEEE